MIDPIIFGDSLITLDGYKLINRNYYVDNKETILDLLAKNYVGQEIFVKCHDGINSKFSGFDDFLKYCCTVIGIPCSKVTYETINLDLDPTFNIKLMWRETFKHALDHLKLPMVPDLHNAKFIGYTIGRMTPSRLRTIYELDKAFANDIYGEVGSNWYFGLEENKKFNDYYTEEIQWIKTKQFAPGHLPLFGLVGWEESYSEYHIIWNNFKIEIVPETDVFSTYYFTEKTARCLATGKPFVLISGANSLDQLRKMGFKTFSPVLDESYDTALYPYKRIKMAVQALQDLYNSPNREDLIDQMYQIAQENIKIYKAKDWWANQIFPNNMIFAQSKKTKSN